MSRISLPTVKSPADATLVIVGSLAAAMIGAILTNILPMYVGAVADTKVLDSQQTGIVASAFFLGFNISGLSAFAWVRKLHWRNVCLGALPIGIGSFLWSAYSHTYLELVTATMLAGASLGVIYTVGTVVIGDTTNHSRWYGVKMAAEAVGGMVLVFLLPITLMPKLGFTGIVIGVGIYCLVLLPALFFLPRGWPKAEAEVSGPTDPGNRLVTDKLAIGVTIVALFTFCLGNAAIWAFAERLGKLGGYSAASIGAVLAATQICGVAGALAVAAVGDRFGSAKCFVFVATIGLIGLVCLNAKGVFLLYALGICVCSTSWVSGSSFAMGEIAGLDKDGRYVALIVPAIGLGSMLGPAITGWLMQIGTTGMALTFSGSTIVASMLLMVFVYRRSRSGSNAAAMAG